MDKEKVDQILKISFVILAIAALIFVISGIWEFNPYNIENFNLKGFGTSGTLIIAVLITAVINDY